jgi:hypothetical protein
VSDAQAEIYTRQGVDFGTLSHLDSIGLALYSPMGFKQTKLRKTASATYHGRTVELTFPQDENNDLQVGRALLTVAGKQLYRVCGAGPVDGFFDYVYSFWERQSLVPKRTIDSAAPEVNNTGSSD